MSKNFCLVFNDGDERVLRRTQVCLKGGKHFDSAVNLDTMPLYHPDLFANSISRDKKKILKLACLIKKTFNTTYCYKS